MATMSSLPLKTIGELFPALGPNSDLPTIVIPDILSGTFDFFFDQLDSDVAANFAANFIGNPNIFTFSNDVDLISQCAASANCIGFAPLSVATLDDGVKVWRCR